MDAPWSHSKANGLVDPIELASRVVKQHGNNDGMQRGVVDQFHNLVKMHLHIDLSNCFYFCFHSTSMEVFALFLDWPSAVHDEPS